MYKYLAYGGVFTSAVLLSALTDEEQRSKIADGFAPIDRAIKDTLDNPRQQVLARGAATVVVATGLIGVWPVHLLSKTIGFVTGGKPVDIEAIKHGARRTAHDVKHAVSETMDTAKDAAQAAGEAIRETAMADMPPVVNAPHGFEIDEQVFDSVMVDPALRNIDTPVFETEGRHIVGVRA